MDVQNTTAAVLGAGEVGGAVTDLLRRTGATVCVRDAAAGHDDDLRGADILHVCIPFKDTEEFASSVRKAVGDAGGTLRYVLVHSTVAPGTTANLNVDSVARVFHCPVRGAHPHIERGLREFTMFVGAAREHGSAHVDSVCEYLRKAGIPCEPMQTSTATELAKLMSTTYYGVCVAAHIDMKRLCERYDVPYAECVVRWNETYNLGCTDGGRGHLVRPVLRNVTEDIGGHCVVPNAEILRDTADHVDMADFVLTKAPA